MNVYSCLYKSSCCLSCAFEAQPLLSSDSWRCWLTLNTLFSIWALALSPIVENMATGQDLPEGKSRRLSQPSVSAGPWRHVYSVMCSWLFLDTTCCTAEAWPCEACSSLGSAEVQSYLTTWAPGSVTMYVYVTWRDDTHTSDQAGGDRTNGRPRQWTSFHLQGEESASFITSSTVPEAASFSAVRRANIQPHRKHVPLLPLSLLTRPWWKLLTGQGSMEQCGEVIVRTAFLLSVPLSLTTAILNIAQYSGAGGARCL